MGADEYMMRLYDALSSFETVNGPATRVPVPEVPATAAPSAAFRRFDLSNTILLGCLTQCR